MSEPRQTILAHLAELRRRLFISVLALVIGSAIVFPFWERVVELLVRPGPEMNLIAVELTETLSTSIKVSMVAGFVLASPVILYQIIVFVAPGLTGREKRYLIVFLPGTLLAFVSGVVFGYFVLLPPLLGFLIGHGSGIIEIKPRVSSTVGQIIRLLFGLGIAFETPLVMHLLARLGIVSARMLSRFRRYWLLVAFIMAAVITPTVDPFNQALVAGPLLALYEVGILLARLAGRGHSSSRVITPATRVD
jgi:sec-independent protein translocase protein TatC